MAPSGEGLLEKNAIGGGGGFNISENINGVSGHVNGGGIKTLQALGLIEV